MRIYFKKEGFEVPYEHIYFERYDHTEEDAKGYCTLKVHNIYTDNYKKIWCNVKITTVEKLMDDIHNAYINGKTIFEVDKNLSR